MTQQQWDERMELLAACCISSDMCKLVHNRTGKWVLVAFGMEQDAGIMTGDACSPELPGGPAVLLRWGTREALLRELGLEGLREELRGEDRWTVKKIVADAILDRVLAGTWDTSKDSPRLADAELIVTE
jgi:hypothetical protein